ncbi:MAG: hypothetical protein V3V26_00980 [Candidatus Aenigmarchaeota archaeon]
MKYDIGTREVAVIAFLIVMAAFGTSVVFFLSHSQEITEVRMHLKVSNYTGFNLDTDALYFGTISPGGSGTRELNLVNGEGEKRTMVFLIGELGKWVYPAENNFIIGKNSNRSLKFTVVVPQDAEFGEYEGTVRLVFTPV